MWRTAADTGGSTFRVQASEVGLAAMSEFVVERPATIFIGMSSRFAKGVGYVWRYVLTTVGPERIYVCMEPPSTTHAGDCMFIVPQVVEGTLWYVVYEGRAVPNDGPFGRLECMSGKPMLCRAGPVTPKRCKRQSGKHLTSWFAHAVRCSCGCVLTCVASWDSTAFLAGLSDAWCVCCYRRLASLDSTASWRGCPMQSNATVELPFDRHKVVMDITFAAWCEVNLEFVEGLLCEAVAAMFCL